MEFFKLFLKILIPLLFGYSLYGLYNSGFFIRLSMAHNLSKIYRVHIETVDAASRYTYAKYITMVMMLIITDQDDEVIKECSENIEKRLTTFINNSICLLSKFKDHDFLQGVVNSTPDELAKTLADLADDLQKLCDDSNDISNTCDRMLIEHVKPANENYLVINAKVLNATKILNKMPLNVIELLKLKFHGSFKEVLEAIGSFTIKS